MQEFNMDKVFSPQAVEGRIYGMWERSGAFAPRIDPAKKPFTIVMPPPNITGQLHVGHALDEMPQDVLIRYHRMKGDPTLWVPGTDHASIATEIKVVEALKKEGIAKEDLGREKFLERAWAWKREYGGQIVKQLRKLGVSCDWTRERFTMDEGLSRAVRETFVRLYEKGLIYRGARIINWCPTCVTALSDAEVEYEEQDSHLWHIRYPGEFGDIVVATTRPETMLGDTGVCVNPNDARYTHMIGKTVTLPLMNRELPIIADEYADLEFGTGAVKMTPAHDPNDFEVAKRHDLPILRVLNDDGTMNENTGRFAGMTREKCRQEVVKELEALGLLVKIEPLHHNVGTCYRCHQNVEPLVSTQWFVKMKPLAEPAIEVARTKELIFVPERFEKTYLNWMENIRDWCISRQLWWGHRIPAWYCSDCGEVTVSETEPQHCTKCGGTSLEQDNDTLDTWFSSALWPFSTLGWPDDTEDMRRFYPTSVLVTAYDIIFFWVARMIFSALEHTGEVPFHTVLIHGIIRDGEGRKMSKSLGNGIDPLEIIDQYGADALRYALVNGNAPGSDQRFQVEKIESGRNFINKIWNAFRFVVMNFDDQMDFSSVSEADFNLEDRWILSRLQTIKGEVTANLDKYEFGIALGKITSLIWEEFCDWSIEMAKPRLNGSQGDKSRLTAQFVLNQVLTESMQLLHPFMPYVSETVYGHLIHAEGSIMVSAWPKPDDAWRFPAEEKTMAALMDAIREVRNIRTQMKVAPARKISLIMVSADEQLRGHFADGQAYLERLAGIGSLKTQADKAGVPVTAVTALFDGGEIYLPLADLIDLDQEIERLEKENENLAKEIGRVSAKLNNSQFVGKAPEKVVQTERDKLIRYQEMQKSAAERLDLLRQEQANR